MKDKLLYGWFLYRWASRYISYMNVKNEWSQEKILDVFIFNKGFKHPTTIAPFGYKWAWTVWVKWKKLITKII